jgi:hypothetical protein
MYQSGTAGCGWHSPVKTLRAQLGSHLGAAELTADVATAAAAMGIDTTAIAVDRRRTNPVMSGLPVDRGTRLQACFSLGVQRKPQTTIGRRREMGHHRRESGTRWGIRLLVDGNGH